MIPRTGAPVRSAVPPARGAGPAARHRRGSAADGPPRMLARHPEQAVVAEEPHQQGRGKRIDLGVGHRPDRPAEGPDVEPPEPLAETERVDERADGLVFGHGGLGRAVEAQDVAQHAQEGRRQRISRPGEQGAGVAQRIFDPPAVEAGAEAHVAALDRHVELAEEPAEVGIGRVVEDDEAGIDRLVAPAPGDDGACMPAEPRLGLEERHPRMTHEREGRGQAGDPATDDGNARGSPPPTIAMRCGFPRRRAACGDLPCFPEVLRA